MQLVRNQGDEFRIGGLAFGVGYGVAEEPLQGVQVPSVPGYLDGVADGPLHPAGGGLEGFGDLGVEDLRDGVGSPAGCLGATKVCCVPFGFIAFFIVPYLTTLRV